MAADDKPILIDLDRGIVGRFEGVDKHVGDQGLLFIKYYPFNSFFGSAKKYDQPVREVAVHTVYPKNREIPGVPDRIVIVYENTQLSLVKGLVEAEKKRNDELERQIDDLRLELAAAQQRAESAQAGAKKLVSDAQEITKSQRPRNVFDPFGAGAGANPGAGFNPEDFQ